MTDELIKHALSFLLLNERIRLDDFKSLLQTQCVKFCCYKFWLGRVTWSGTAPLIIQGSGGTPWEYVRVSTTLGSWCHSGGSS